MLEAIEQRSNIREETERSSFPVLILAGGLGTRLQEIIKDEIPKSLTEIYPGFTFIDQLLDGLKMNGFKNYFFVLVINMNK